MHLIPLCDSKLLPPDEADAMRSRRPLD